MHASVGKGQSYYGILKYSDLKPENYRLGFDAGRSINSFIAQKIGLNIKGFSIVLSI